MAVSHWSPIAWLEWFGVGNLMRQFDESFMGPLDGVRVLDLSRLVAGNMVSLQLADYGAEVIKVEPPSGDITRQVGESRTPGMAAGFLGKGRNKRSLALDLKQDVAREALYKFVATADVFIHNIRPGAAARPEGKLDIHGNPPESLLSLGKRATGRRAGESDPEQRTGERVVRVAQLFVEVSGRPIAIQNRKHRRSPARSRAHNLS